jgi:hypothetical protein
MTNLQLWTLIGFVCLTGKNSDALGLVILLGCLVGLAAS